MEQYLKTLLAGIRQWTNNKLQEISFVVSSHIVELTQRVQTLENYVVHKKLIVDDISEFLYDVSPKSLESYGFNSTDVQKFLNDDLAVDVTVDVLKVLIKSSVPGLYSVYDEFFPNWIKSIIGNIKSKFSTQEGEVCKIPTLSEIASSSNIQSYINEHKSELPGVEADSYVINVYKNYADILTQSSMYVYILGFIINFIFLRYFEFENVKFISINNFSIFNFFKICSLVAVTDNQLALLNVINNQYYATKNSYPQCLFIELLKDVPRDENYTLSSALMALLDYYEDNFPTEMQSYYESQGYADYSEFSTVFSTVLSNIPENNDIIVNNIIYNFLLVMRTPLESAPE